MIQDVIALEKLDAIRAEKRRVKDKSALSRGLAQEAKQFIPKFSLLGYGLR